MNLCLAHLGFIKHQREDRLPPQLWTYDIDALDILAIPDRLWGSCHACYLGWQFNAIEDGILILNDPNCPENGQEKLPEEYKRFKTLLARVVKRDIAPRASPAVKNSSGRGPSDKD